MKNALLMLIFCVACQKQVASNPNETASATPASAAISSGVPPVVEGKQSELVCLHPVDAGAGPHSEWVDGAGNVYVQRPKENTSIKSREVRLVLTDRPNVWTDAEGHAYVETLSRE